MPSSAGQQGRLVYPLELQQSTPRTEKITLRGPSAIPALCPRKVLTRRSSFWSLPAPPHTSTIQAVTHNGAENLLDIKKLKQMQY